MRCPYCGTINREDRAACYHCGKDLGMLRLIHNRARHHYNTALEHAERGRHHEAIGELRNALQLDGHFTDARLLLGTLYARLHRIDEARDQWNRVLAEDPNSRRAHEYIDSLPQVREALPLLQRLRLLVGGFLIVLIVLATMAMWFAWPSREGRLLEQAWNQFAQRDLAASTETLQRLPRPLRDNALEARAVALEQSTERLIAERLALVQDHTARGDVRSALGQLRRLRAWELPGPASEALRQQENLLRLVLEEQLAELAAAEFTASNKQRLLERIEEASLLFPRDEIGAAAREQFRTTGREELESHLLKIDEALLRGEVTFEAQLLLERAGELVALLDEQHERLERRRAPFEQALAERSLRQAHAALDRNAPEEAMRILNNVSAWPADSLAEARNLEASATRAVADRKIEEINELIRREAWEEVLAIDLETVTAHLAEEERNEVERELAIAGRRHAAQTYYRLMRMADDIEAGAISAGDAQRVLASVEIIRTNGLPTRIELQAEEHLLFFEAVAHLLTDQSHDASDTIARLEAWNAKSPYLRAFERLRAQRDGV